MHPLTSPTTFENCLTSQAALGSEEGILSLETLELVFSQRTRRDEIYQLGLCRFAQAAKFRPRNPPAFPCGRSNSFPCPSNFPPPSSRRLQSRRTRNGPL